jgi:hypothetical protein
MLIFMLAIRPEPSLTEATSAMASSEVTFPQGRLWIPGREQPTLAPTPLTCVR